VCGYAVEWLRSCYRSTWFLPETGSAPIRGRYWFNDDAPFYPNEHAFTSRNWSNDAAAESAPYGEQPGKQTYDKGGFPTKHPDPVLVGTDDCIANGEHAGEPDWQIVLVSAAIHLNPGDTTPQGYLNPSTPTTFYIISDGPFASAPAALAFGQAHYPPFTLVCPASFIGAPFVPDAFTAAAAGYYLRVEISKTTLRTLNCAPFMPCTIEGLPCECWANPPKIFKASGGSKQGGAAAFPVQYSITGSGGARQNGSAYFAEGYTIVGTGGAKQNGSAALAAGFGILAQGGAKENGSAALAAGFGILAQGGAKENGSAALAAGFGILAAGGAKQNGSAGIVNGYAITGSGGAKENGQGSGSAAATLYCQSTHGYLTCDSLSTTNKDLGPTVSSGTQAFTTTSTSYVRVGSYKINFSGTSGTYTAQLHITAATGTFRFRLEILDGSCAIVASTPYTADLNSTGTFSTSGSITWPAGGASVCIRIDVKKTGGVGPTGCVVTQDSTSYVIVSP
jgi:hypothetical protein